MSERRNEQSILHDYGGGSSEGVRWSKLLESAGNWAARLALALVQVWTWYLDSHPASSLHFSKLFSVLDIILGGLNHNMGKV